MEKKNLYTLMVYSENVAGILNQITAVFTERRGSDYQDYPSDRKEDRCDQGQLLHGRTVVYP